MICFPNAKINIGLNIVEKRTDGFHNIETVFYPVQLCDVLEIIESSKFEFSNSGIAVPNDGKENLCVKAYRLLSKEFQLPPVKIHLHKIVPIGAGLGGGSSDAALTIKALNNLFQLNLSKEKMKDHARQLGSDCAFFIENDPMFAYERGDKFKPVQLDMNDHFIALVTPDIHVSTAEAYAGTAPKKPETSLEKLISLPIGEWKNNIYNDFEDSVFTKYPAIKTIKEKLYSLGAIYASMSGSGSSVYGVFKESKTFESDFPNCKIWKSKL